MPVLMTAINICYNIIKVKYHTIKCLITSQPLSIINLWGQPCAIGLSILVHFFFQIYLLKDIF